MEEIIQLFEICEEQRHQEEIDGSPEVYPPIRGTNYFRIYHNRFQEKLKTHNYGGTTESGENLEAIKTNRLSIDQASAIFMYTHHQIYEQINQKLRNCINLDVDQKAYINLLNKGLDKLDSINNTILYRDIYNPEGGVINALDYYESNINNSIQFNDFLSCHTDNVRISDEETDFQFVIKTSSNSNAKNIQTITFINNENEVLIKNGTTFKIDRVDRTNNRVFISEI